MPQRRAALQPTDVAVYRGAVVGSEKPTDLAVAKWRQILSSGSGLNRVQQARRGAHSLLRCAMDLKKTSSNRNQVIVGSHTTVEPVLVPAVKAAQFLGLPYNSPRDCAHRGGIPVIKVGTAWYFRKTDLNRWVSSRAEVLR